MVNKEKEFTSPLNPVQLCSHGNQVETSMSSCGHTCAEVGSGSEKGKTKN